MQTDIIQAQQFSKNEILLFRLAGILALLLIIPAFVDIGISMLSENEITIGALTVVDYFNLYEKSSFLVLRELGFINIIINLMMVPIFLAFYFILRRFQKATILLAVGLFLIGITIYISNNCAFAMLSLCKEYASAIEVQKPALLAAGEALLVQGEDFTFGSFLGFFM